MNQPTIIQTERGLTIAGTRITLYDVMDYVTAQYPPQFIRALFNLSEAQIEAAFNYIQEHRDLVEQEYQVVLKEAEELQQYYEARNRDLIAKIRNQPPKPGTETIRAKLKQMREKRMGKNEILNRP